MGQCLSMNGSGRTTNLGVGKLKLDTQKVIKPIFGDAESRATAQKSKKHRPWTYPSAFQIGGSTRCICISCIGYNTAAVMLMGTAT